ncbi:hypothetical protein [Hymenobacter pini]|uniref:hypothetical protein n=1 Tax=Hymenobacter pini TaxID=2880879 RepID=UPI001CF26AE0|nr:hypothetical protein [Hymenobacter pini]MCA8832853.1 hypothetical protein [Hymenobacter pini]
MENRPLYSAEITEIIGTPPSWNIRVGGGVLLLVLALLLTGASVIGVPQHNSTPVSIRSTAQPHYLVQPAGTLQLLVEAGQAIQPGQALARVATDTVRAPFAGTLQLLHLAGTPVSPGDTLGMLVPLHNAYQFSGRLDIGQVAELRRNNAFPIQVLLDSRTETSLHLQGRLGYVNPVVRNGQVSYTGQLDSASNTALAQHVATINNLTGTLHLSSRRTPILTRLFN